MAPEPADNELQDEPLREEDVTAGDRLDDRVEEAEGLPGDEPDED